MIRRARLFTTSTPALWALLWICCSPGLTVAQPQPAAVTPETPQLEPLPYNHPGLAVDLGVGLWAWPIPCDADGDGDYDLIVSCPDKPSNGIWLFENTTGDTADNKFPIFAPARRLSHAVHYVMPSYIDGKLRVLTPGYEYPDFLQTGLEQRVKLPVEPNFYRWEGTQSKGPKVRHNQWRMVDYDGDGLIDLVVGIEDWSHYGWDDAWNSEGEWTNGPLRGFVFWLRNQGTNARPVYDDPVKIHAEGKPIDVYGCPSPNFADFDGDGDLDLLCGEFLDGFTYFENIGTRTAPRYAAGRRLLDASGQPLVMDLQMIVPIAFDWDRDGDLDLIVGDEDGRVALLENTGELSADRTPVFAAPRYFQQQAESLKSGALATPVGFDWDGDGDFDLLVGNTAGYIEYFENLSGPGVEQPRWAAPVRLEVDGEPFRVLAGPNGSIQGPAEAKWGYTTLTVADWDGDGLPDIIYNSIWGRVEWLKNRGPRQHPRLAPPQPIEVAWTDTVPKPAWTWWEPEGNALVTQWRTTPLAIDWNQNGLTDLIMLDHEGYLAFYERQRQGDELILLPPQRIFYQQNAKGKKTWLQLNNKQAGGSGRRKLCLVDWDGDGKIDLLVNSTNANFYQQVESEAGTVSFIDRGPISSRNIQGHTTSPTVVDFNNNGQPDFLGGAEDGRLYYLRNPNPRP